MLTKQEQEISERALVYVRQSKKQIQQKFADNRIYTPSDHPITVFMAGVPGAGKTEVSKRLIDEFDNKAVRIDADDIRDLFVTYGYNGKNSYIFQRACAKGVDILFDYVQQKKLHAIVDGTFQTKNSLENVRRALGRGRKVFIYYIYQDPFVAWKAVRGRESKEGRHIPKDAFIDAYFQSHDNANFVKKEYGQKVVLNLIIKNAEEGMEKQILNIGTIDGYIKKVYRREELEVIA